MSPASGMKRDVQTGGASVPSVSSQARWWGIRSCPWVVSKGSSRLSSQSQTSVGGPPKARTSPWPGGELK